MSIVMPFLIQANFAYYHGIMARCRTRLSGCGRCSFNLIWIIAFYPCFMDDEILQSIARQLRKPDGDLGIQVAKKMNEGNLHINRYTIDALHVQECDQILEIGMGNGFFVSEILTGRPLVKYVGCDFSPVMVREAEIMNESFIAAGQAEFRLTSAETLPFDDGMFDKVFSVNTIYFWDDSRVILSEIRRVLEPKGKIVISVRPKATMKSLPFVKYGFKTFSKEDLKALLTQNSFTVTAVIEKREPDQEINGDKIPMESLIVCAMK